MFLHIPPTAIQKLYSHLFQISAFNRRKFAISVKELGTRLMPAPSVALNSSHQVLEEILTNSTTFMLSKKMIHQEIVTANLQQFTSDPGLLLPKSVLWFQLSYGDLIIMTLIMVMFRFTLWSIHLNLPLNFFHIRTQLRSTQLMTIKWVNSWDSSTQMIVMVFLILTSRCVRID